MKYACGAFDGTRLARLGARIDRFAAAPLDLLLRCVPTGSCATRKRGNACIRYAVRETLAERRASIREFSAGSARRSQTAISDRAAVCSRSSMQRVFARDLQGDRLYVKIFTGQAIRPSYLRMQE